MSDESDLVYLGASIVNMLPAGATMCGTIASSSGHQIQLDGAFEGRIELGGKSSLVVGREAVVQVELAEVERLVVQGKVSGTIRARHVELYATGTIHGTLIYGESLVCERGANLSANVKGPRLATIS